MKIWQGINYYKNEKSKTLVITTGITIKVGLEINKINVDLIDIFKIKPFPVKEIEKLLKLISTKNNYYRRKF